MFAVGASRDAMADVLHALTASKQALPAITVQLSQILKGTGLILPHFDSQLTD